MDRRRLSTATLAAFAVAPGLAGLAAGTAAAATSTGTRTAGHIGNSGGLKAVPEPVVANCTGRDQVRPGSFVLACADGNNALTGLSWTVWSPAMAAGTGTQVANDCTPDCAEGHFHRFGVDVMFWRSEPLPHHPGARYFTRVTLLYPGSRPPTYADGKPVTGPDTVTLPLAPS